MFVCLCNRITDSQIRRAARDGITSLNALQDELGIATQCGQCRDTASAVLAEILAAREASASPLFYAADSGAAA